MKRHILIIAAVATSLAACTPKTETKTEKDMTSLTFNTEQAAAMSAIACNEAKADYTALAEAINDGLDAGLTVSQVKEALSHLYAYTGFPRSLNALGTLQKVLEQRKAEGKSTEEGVEASPLPADYNALTQGTEVQTKVSGRAFNYDFCPAEDYYLKAHLFGDIFARDNLTHADRELVTVSALSGLENVMPQLQAHVRGALNMGVSEEQLRNIPVALKANGLQAEALRCESAIAVAVDGKTDVVCAQSPWPIGDPNTAFAQYFIGNSYLAVLDPASGLCNVSFEPCCRNNWHVHHDAVQHLVCVSGRGWYQEWGKEPVELVPGVVIAVPEGVKHWHGAAKDSWMQHLTYHTDVKPGNSTEWLEPVDDEWYGKIK
ncbi:MAG: carboxymuconolactone decarboxylase family protein [Bacteroidales bacterium]|nr:carboxymuconolactone decarboxylase family protein [Bacteroidales bacterium]